MQAKVNKGKNKSRLPEEKAQVIYVIISITNISIDLWGIGISIGLGEI